MQGAAGSPVVRAGWRGPAQPRPVLSERLAPNWQPPRGVPEAQAGPGHSPREGGLPPQDGWVVLWRGIRSRLGWNLAHGLPGSITISLFAVRSVLCIEKSALP